MTRWRRFDPRTHLSVAVGCAVFVVVVLAVQVRFDWQDTPETAAGAPDTPARVRMECIDDGAGFDIAAPTTGHYGLAGMREQAALIDARLELTRWPGKGTRIVLEFDA